MAKRHAAVRPNSEREDFDYDNDLDYLVKNCVTEDAARQYAQKLIDDGVTFFGCARIVKQTVDWYVEEDRVAEWVDVGESEEISS